MGEVIDSRDRFSSAAPPNDDDETPLAGVLALPQNEIVDADALKRAA